MNKELLEDHLNHALKVANFDEIKKVISWDDKNHLGSYEDIVLNNIMGLMKSAQKQSEKNRAIIFNSLLDTFDKKMRNSYTTQFLTYIEQITTGAVLQTKVERKEILVQLSRILNKKLKDIKIKPEDLKDIFYQLAKLDIEEIPSISPKLRREIIEDKEFFTICSKHGNYSIFQDLLDLENQKLTELPYFDSIMNNFKIYPPEVLEEIFLTKSESIANNISFLYTFLKVPIHRDQQNLKPEMKKVLSTLYNNPSSRQEFIDLILDSRNLEVFQFVLTNEAKFATYFTNTASYGEYRHLEGTKFFITASQYAHSLKDKILLEEEIKSSPTPTIGRATLKI